jgi:hypothetical protein
VVGTPSKLIDNFRDIPQFLRTNFGSFTLIRSLRHRSTHTHTHTHTLSLSLSLSQIHSSLFLPPFTAAGRNPNRNTDEATGWMVQGSDLCSERHSSVVQNRPHWLRGPLDLLFNWYQGYSGVGGGRGGGGWGVMLDTPVPSFFNSKHSLQYPQCLLNFMWRCCVCSCV